VFLVWFWLFNSELGWCWWWSGVARGADMERHFSVEAKKFFFSMREDKAEFCLEERRKDVIGYVLLGVQ
jgi:hypothetical protein